MSNELQQSDDATPKSSAKAPTNLPAELAADTIVVERAITELLAQQVRSSESSLEQAMASNLKETHIDKILELNVLKETNRHTEQTDRLKNQPRTLLVGIAGLLFFLTIFSYMAFYFSKAEIILPVITGLGGMIFGALGGYGYGSRHKAKRDDMLQ